MTSLPPVSKLPTSVLPLASTGKKISEVGNSNFSIFQNFRSGRGKNVQGERVVSKKKKKTTPMRMMYWNTILDFSKGINLLEEKRHLRGY